MSKEASRETLIEPKQVEAYLRRRGYEDVELLELRPLGLETQEGLKAYGYGRPLRARFMAAGRENNLVIRTMSPDPFGHQRRSDRAEQMIMSFDTFPQIPRHIQPEDIGAFDDNGEMISIPRGELFLVSNYVEGELYAHNLVARVKEDCASASEKQRAATLAKYLAELHSVKADPKLYARDLRDTVGSGEGILGQCDAYPMDHPVITPARLQKLEAAAVGWRWKLRGKAHRCSRTHGDFHPFNILFRADDDFTVLDCSRGGVGEPADDLTALSINFMAFSYNYRGEFAGVMRDLWDVFWKTYLEASGDDEILQAVAPYFMWRTLVVVSPIWYPDLGPRTRDTVLRFAEQLLDGKSFDPTCVEELLS